MANPQVNLKTGKVAWTDPTLNTDNSPVTAGEITGYQVGFRSVTAAGSVVGTYPILGQPVASTAVSEAISAVMTNLTVDTYAASVRAVTASGNSAWGTEFVFDGVLPLPLYPTGISVS